MTSQTTPRPASIAVATTDGLLPNAPSPMSATTARSGCADLDAQRRRRPEAHRRQPARRDEGAGHGDRELLADAVLVPADVGDDVAVLGNGLAQLAEDPLRTHRVLARAVLIRPVGGEGAAAAGDLGAQRAARSRASTPARAVGPAPRARASRRRRRRARSGSCGRSPRRRRRCGSSRVGGMSKVKRGSHELEFASARRVPTARITSAVRHFSLAIGVPQKPVMPSSSG